MVYNLQNSIDKIESRFEIKIKNVLQQDKNYQSTWLERIINKKDIKNQY